MFETGNWVQGCSNGKEEIGERKKGEREIAVKSTTSTMKITVAGNPVFTRIKEVVGETETYRFAGAAVDGMVFHAIFQKTVATFSGNYRRNRRKGSGAKTLGEREL